MPGVKVSGLDRAEDWFRRHGEMAGLMGRMVPLVRSLVSIPAGLERMSLRRFTVCTALGSAAWMGARRFRRVRPATPARRRQPAGD